MYFTFIGIVVLIVTLYLVFFTRTRTLFYFTFVMSAFTSTSIINFPKSRNSVLCFYVVGSFLILKVLYEVIVKRYTFKRIRFSNGLLYFLIYATISLILPVVHSSGTLVFTPDSPYDYISFSFQNITQYLYLLFAFIIYLCSYMVIVNEVKVNIKKIIDITTSVVLILGFVQFFISHEYFDFIFRTNYSHLVQYLETGLTRISSVTNEPSMLAMFLTPIFIYYFISIIDGLKIRRRVIFDVVMFVLILIISLLNRSSSFYLAIAIVSIILLIDYSNKIFNNRNKSIVKSIFKEKIVVFIKNNKIKSIIVALVVLVLIALVFRVIGFRFLILSLKLLGLDDSGSTRIELFSYHMGIFLKNLFTGVGFGTLRSNDLLSMWAAQVGLMGMVPLIYYFVSRTMYIFKNRDSGENRYVFYLIITTLIILATSVPEPYYIYTWIYLAIGETIYRRNEVSSRSIDKLTQRDYVIEITK